MTTVRLAHRVDRITIRLEIPQAEYRLDLNRLTGMEADRLVVLGYASVSGAVSAEEVEEFQELAGRCRVLMPDDSISRPFAVPRQLESYWRLQRLTNEDFSLPGGNYRFNRLCFADRERLMALCKRYGWHPRGDAPNIAPLTRWAKNHLTEISALLWQATSEMERDLWNRRH